MDMRKSVHLDWLLEDMPGGMTAVCRISVPDSELDTDGKPRLAEKTLVAEFRDPEDADAFRHLYATREWRKTQNRVCRALRKERNREGGNPDAV